MNRKPDSFEALELHIIVGIVKLDRQKSSGVEYTTLRQAHSKAKNLSQCVEYVPSNMKIASMLRR